MKLLHFSLARSLIPLFTQTTSPPPHSLPPSSTLSTDVCIIGGGASGSYTALRLTELGKQVLVLEKSSLLGGHTETFVDTQTKTSIDTGVIIWHNTSLVQSLFSRLSVPLADLTAPPVTQHLIDFRDGSPLNTWTPPSPAEEQAALARYADEVLEYPSLLNGYDLPDPVPEDLLLPLGEWLEKHSLQNVTRLLYNFAQGLIPILQNPTLYVLTQLGPHFALTMKYSGMVKTAAHQNQLLYDAITERLRPSILFNSHPVRIIRSPSSAGEQSGVQILAATPTGPTLIHAKKLIIAIPPTLATLAPFLDLSPAESEVFGHLSGTWYTSGVLNETRMPPDVGLFNGANGQPYGLPVFPALYSVSAEAGQGLDGYLSFFHASPAEMHHDEIKGDVRRVLNMMYPPDAESGARGAGAGGGCADDDDATARFLAMSTHGPFELMAEVDAIRGGLYRRMRALQGERNTWWVGAAWSTQDSSVIWNVTEAMLPRVLESLG